MATDGKSKNNTFGKMKKKINWLLILQGWAMLWVVIGHSPISLDNMPSYVRILYDFAYSFHMPLFILDTVLISKLSTGKMEYINTN